VHQWFNSEKCRKENKMKKLKEGDTVEYNNEEYVVIKANPKVLPMANMLGIIFARQDEVTLLEGNE
jgi:hypothetical protein